MDSYEMYNLMQNIQTNFPQWRFGQFVENFRTWFRNKYCKDFYYVPDEEIFIYLNKFIKEMHQ